MGTTTPPMATFRYGFCALAELYPTGSILLLGASWSGIAQSSGEALLIPGDL